jgi:hypothetical protein
MTAGASRFVIDAATRRRVVSSGVFCRGSVLLAPLLVAAVPVALLAAVVMMMLGYVVSGLALSPTQRTSGHAMLGGCSWRDLLRLGCGSDEVIAEADE